MRPNKKIEAFNALFRKALASGYHDEKARAAVRYLRQHGNRFIFEKAAAWCLSNSPYKRARGADILCQLRRHLTAEQRSSLNLKFAPAIFVGESFAILARMAVEENNDDTLHSVLFGLGHLYDEAAVPILTQFAKHPNNVVRFAVAWSLGCFSHNEMAVEALIALMTDSDTDVRNWATFAIGTQADADTPEIREALFQRLGDKSSVVREEGIAGLAKRKDPRAALPLLRLMQMGTYFVHHDHDFAALVDAEDIARDWDADDFIKALYAKFPELLPAR